VIDRLLRRRKARLCDDRHDVWSACGGYSYNSACYYLGHDGDSCTTICSTHGTTNLAGTVSIGSGGTNTGLFSCLDRRNAANCLPHTAAFQRA